MPKPEQLRFMPLVRGYVPSLPFSQLHMFSKGKYEGLFK